MATGGEEEEGVGMGLAVPLMPPRVCTRQSKCQRRGSCQLCFAFSLGLTKFCACLSVHGQEQHQAEPASLMCQAPGHQMRRERRQQLWRTR